MSPRVTRDHSQTSWRWNCACPENVGRSPLNISEQPDKISLNDLGFRGEGAIKSVLELPMNLR